MLNFLSYLEAHLLLLLDLKMKSIGIENFPFLITIRYVKKGI